MRCRSPLEPLSPPPNNTSPDAASACSVSDTTQKALPPWLTKHLPPLKIIDHASWQAILKKFIAMEELLGFPEGPVCTYTALVNVELRSYRGELIFWLSVVVPKLLLLGSRVVE